MSDRAQQLQRDLQNRFSQFMTGRDFPHAQAAAQAKTPHLEVPEMRDDGHTDEGRDPATQTMPALQGHGGQDISGAHQGEICVTPVPMGILWNGGWDDYIVDIDDQIDDDGTHGSSPLIYPDEIRGVPVKKMHNCGDPHYVRTHFSGKMSQRFPGKALRVLSHEGGGGD